jgi:hypothetical protein
MGAFDGLIISEGGGRIPYRSKEIVLGLFVYDKLGNDII